MINEQTKVANLMWWQNSIFLRFVESRIRERNMSEG